MLNQFLIDITPYLKGIAYFLVVYGGRYIVALAKNRTTKDQRDTAKDIILGAVMFVEQITKKNLEILSIEKFDMAKQRAWQILTSKGLEVSEAELEMLIEAFVLQLKGLD